MNARPHVAVATSTSWAKVFLWGMWPETLWQHCCLGGSSLPQGALCAMPGVGRVARFGASESNPSLLRGLILCPAPHISSSICCGNGSQLASQSPKQPLHAGGRV